MCALLGIVLALFTLANADYWGDREAFVKSEAFQAMGSSTRLSDKEAAVNKLLMSFKLKEYDDGLANPQNFTPAVHFFKSKRMIEESTVFKMIQHLPKGASLHSHDLALVSEEYLFNLTYLPDLYACFDNNTLRFKFFRAERAAEEKLCEWTLVTKIREDVKNFDTIVRSQMSIIVQDPDVEYKTSNDVWLKFTSVFNVVRGLVCYKPVFQAYFYQALRELVEDNVMYLEFRSTLPTVYDLDGKEYKQTEVVELYLETLDRFKKDYPQFIGAKVIYAPYRGVDRSTFAAYEDQVMALKHTYGHFFAGFDLVGQEDRGKPLIDFAEGLSQMRSYGVKMFFHAGETNWNGVSTDMNLIDAVLLNATRIGHGFGVVKHPLVLKKIREKEIAIEVSPISNQVLKLVDDLRNHPGAFLVANDYPMVITCDDPSFWGARGLSYDWYLAFMGFGSREADLKLLKQFAINSLVHSAMNPGERMAAISKWLQSWDTFIDDMAPGLIDIMLV